MSELLIELFCEEIPAMMQTKAESAYLEIFTKYFERKEISFADLSVFIGPRRITIYAKDVDKKTKSRYLSLKGPRIDSPLSAIEGFCKSNNISRDKLVIKNVKGQDCYFYEQEINGQQVKTILFDSLSEPIMEYVWPKSMYWSNYKIKWVRPLKNILCLFNSEVIPFKLEHLTANNITFGHRFLGSGQKQLIIKDFSDYNQKMTDNFVILDRSKRKHLIKTALESTAQKLGLHLKDDPLLLEEVTGLAEYPVVLAGQIQQKFLDLPSEVLVSSMRLHQKYFSLFDTNGKFAPYFLFVSNIDSPEVVTKGNEKVLSARLADALYFYHQDLKKPLESALPELAKVTFHGRLGSLKDKVDRLQKLVLFLDSNAKSAAEAALICKSDIVSEVVSEFPNLQGIMGYYYARNSDTLGSGTKEAVAIAIRDHYKPQGPSDVVPSGDAAILALADKIDSLCGLMMAGEKPTGSKDPYALRRLALGIVRIILENNLEQDLTRLVRFACSLYSQIDQKSENIEQIISFIQERIRNYFKDKFDYNAINAVVDCNMESNLLVMQVKLEALDQFLQTARGKDLLGTYKRIYNIINSNNRNLKGTINQELFGLHEKELFNKLKIAVEQIDAHILRRNFVAGLEILAEIKQQVSSFFDNVMVLDKNPEIANNRLLLLEYTKKVFRKIADFDQLQTSNSSKSPYEQ